MRRSDGRSHGSGRDGVIRHPVFGRATARLALLLSLSFAAATLGMLFVASTALQARLAAEDRERLQSIALDLWSRYQLGGAESLVSALQSNQFILGDNTLLRITDPANRTVLQALPGVWEGLDVSALAEGSVPLSGFHTLRISTSAGNLRVELVGISLDGSYILQLAASTEAREATLAQLRGIIGATALGGILVVVTLAVLSAWRVFTPIRAIATAVDEVLATGDVGQRVAARSRRDDLGALVTRFNQMLDRIQALVDGMEQTVDGIAHDTRTPLSRIRIEAEQALAAAAETGLHADDSREATRAGLERILDEVAGLQQMLQGVFDLRAMEAGSLRPGMQVHSLEHVLVPLLESAQMVCEESGLELTLDQDADTLACSVRVDLHRARQAISNVLDNAMSYAQSKVVVTLGPRGSDLVELAVENDGELPGPGELAELWRLRYRGQNSRSQSGLGIGLPFVQAVSRLHGWDAALDVSESRFRLTLTLPICKDPESCR